MKKTLASLTLALLLLIVLAPAVLAAPGDTGDATLNAKLTNVVNIAIGLSKGIGIIGAIAGAAGLVLSPNPESKQKFKTVLFGCILLALASVIVDAVFKIG